MAFNFHENLDVGNFDTRTPPSFVSRGRHGTGTVFRKIFSPWDSPPKLRPGIPRPGPSSRSQIFQFWVPVPNPRFSGFASESRIFDGILQIPAVPFVPDFSMRPGPSHGSRIFQVSTFEFESRSQSRILKWVPITIPDFRDCGIPGTLSRMPTSVRKVRKCSQRKIFAYKILIRNSDILVKTFTK